jgi:hypothetical protein
VEGGREASSLTQAITFDCTKNNHPLIFQKTGFVFQNEKDQSLIIIYETTLLVLNVSCSGS